jgi:glycosyltransferase involved in cell wall biosynthesis
MDQNWLVSIIINNFNYGRFLPAAINSALWQSHPLTEVIVVDDGSIDNSHEIIASYQDRVIPVLTDNGGQAAAFNAGFAKSTGDIVIFLDADDELRPHTAALVVEQFMQDPTLAKVQYRLAVIDAFVEASSWLDHLAVNPATRSNTSVCLKIVDPDIAALDAGGQAAFAKAMVSLLDKEGVAFDIGAYRDAPPGLRIWAGATVETADLEALMPWLDWAFEQQKSALKAAA